MYKVGLADALLPLPGCLGCFRLLPVDRVGEGVAGPAAVDKAILMGSAASHPSIWVSHSLCLPIARPSSTRSWHSASRRAMCAWNEHLHFPVFVTSYTQRQLPRRGLPHARTHRWPQHNMRARASNSSVAAYRPLGRGVGLRSAGLSPLASDRRRKALLSMVDAIRRKIRAMTRQFLRNNSHLRSTCTHMQQAQSVETRRWPPRCCPYAAPPPS